MISSTIMQDYKWEIAIHDIFQCPSNNNNSVDLRSKQTFCPVQCKINDKLQEIEINKSRSISPNISKRRVVYAQNVHDNVSNISSCAQWWPYPSVVAVGFCGCRHHHCNIKIYIVFFFVLPSVRVRIECIHTFAYVRAHTHRRARLTCIDVCVLVMNDWRRFAGWRSCEIPASPLNYVGGSARTACHRIAADFG